MSGILSALSSAHSPDAIILLTDGAIYDRNGSLLAIRRKVTISDSLPLAVCFRGNFAFGEITSRQIIAAAEEIGFDRMLSDLEADLPNMPTSPDLEIVIAGVSETAGPMHRRFLNKQMIGDRAPRTLIDPGPMYFGFGTDGRAVTLAGMGVPPPRKDETIETWLSRHGVSIFEYFRRISVPTDTADSDRQYLIGGICDMTVVKRGSVSTTLLHRWPDKVGEKIDPDISQKGPADAAGLAFGLFEAGVRLS
jgi:hypothetical protein